MGHHAKTTSPEPRNPKMDPIVQCYPSEEKNREEKEENRGFS